MNKEKTKIERIHFLIHPGFGANTEQGEFAEETDRYLHRRYIEQAASLTVQEIMLIFNQTSRISYAHDKRADYAYTHTIEKIMTILGSRGLLFHDGDWDVLSGTGNKTLSPSFVDTIKKAIDTNGFSFDESVDTEAYGECLTACVADGAESLNASLLLQKETIIRSRLTENILASHDSIMEMIRELREKDEHSCIIFDCEEL